MIRTVISGSVFAILLSLSAFGGDHTHSYHHLKEVFAAAEFPSAESVQPGWYSGRCFSLSAPEKEKAGVMGIFDAGNGQVKTIIPVASVDGDSPDRWDEIDDEELADLTANSFVGNNEPAYQEGNSLVSMLTYERLAGKLHTREMHGHLLVKYTNAYPEDETVEPPHFFCHLDRKVR